MNVLRIKETCIYVTDLHATKDFYAGRLRLPMISLVEGRHVFFKAGGSVLLCFVADKTRQEKELPPHGAGGAVHFAFEVAPEAYDKARQEIQDAGIGILHHHIWLPGHRSFYFHDPGENVAEIIEEGMWEAGVE